MSVLIDSYPESNSSAYWVVGDGQNMGHYYSVGQSITGNGKILEKCVFYFLLLSLGLFRL